MKRRTIEPRTTLAALSVLVAPLAHALDDAGARAAIRPAVFSSAASRSWKVRTVGLVNRE